MIAAVVIAFAVLCLVGGMAVIWRALFRRHYPPPTKRRTAQDILEERRRRGHE